MFVLGYLCALLALCWVVGFSAVVVLQLAFPISLYRVRAVRFTLPIIGYIVACLVWWLGTFVLQLRDAIVLAAIAAIVVIALALLAKRRFPRRRLLALLPARCDWPAAVAVAFVAAVTVWPYALSGLGNYFLYNDTDWFNRVTPAILHHREVADVVRLVSRESIARLLTQDFPLEISNLMLPQAVLGLDSNDSALLQAVLDLMFTALGAFWLSRYIFRLRETQAAIAAVLSVVAQFYFASYLDGHIGSTIYTSAAPYFFGLSSWALARNRYRSTLTVLALLWVFVKEAYASASVIILFPLALAKMRLIYLDHAAAVRTFIRGTRKEPLPVRAIALLALALSVAAVAGVCLFAYDHFYPNRVAALLGGYSPMYIVFDPQVLEWFYGLRLTSGFSYGFLDPGVDLRLYNQFATLLAVILSAGILVGSWRLLRARAGSFLALYLITLPVSAVLFALLIPFSYFVYKILEIHYFLVVIGAVAGFSFVLESLRRSRKWAAVAIGVLIAGAVGINVFGTVMNSRISLQRSQQVDPAEVASLIRKMKSAGVKDVAIHVDGNINALLYGFLRYALADANLGMGYGDAVAAERVGHPLLTPQFSVFNPVPAPDVSMASDNARYVVGKMPDTLIDVTASQGVETRHGIVFLWLHTPLDYTVLSVDREFRQLAGFAASLPGSPVFYDDLSDSGNYELVNALMDKYGIRHSNDPRRCQYFIRLRGKLIQAATDLKVHPGGQRDVIAGISDSYGEPATVSQAYRNTGTDRTLWRSDVFEVVHIPPAGRRMTLPDTIDLPSLLAAIRNGHLRVLNDIRPAEYERYFLDTQLTANGIHLAGSAGSANAALLAVPTFMLASSGGAGIAKNATYWQSGGSSYRIVLVPVAVWKTIVKKERGPLWTLQQPLRTLLLPTNGVFLQLRVYRTDRIMRLVLGTGPSRRVASSLLRVMRPDGKADPLFFTVDSPTQLLDVPIARFAVRGEASTTIAIEPMLQVPQRVMPYDDRILSYELLEVEEAREGAPPYSARMKTVLQTLTAEGSSDILDPADAPALTLGAGWFDREAEAQKPFRWMSDRAQLVFESKETKLRQIVIDGAAGPSAGTGPIVVNASLNGTPIEAEEVDAAGGHVTVRVNLDAAGSLLKSGQNVIGLSVSGDRKPVAGDPRVLEFRVFHIGLSAA
jgi:hypothetical protein